MREAPVAWPHDGGRGASIVDGATIAATYKKLGLNMLPEHATFPDGGYSFGAGIQLLQNRFEAEKLKIAEHLTEARDEYQGYHFEKGLVKKEDDDIMSALRVGCMQIRSARTIDRFNYKRAEAGATVAAGVDFDLFAGA